MFVGPPARGLLACLIKPEHGKAADLERRALQCVQDLLPYINSLLGYDLDLYALQFLPCIWGKFLRGSQRLLESQVVDNGEESSVEAVIAQGILNWANVLASLRMSKARRQAERVKTLESRYIREFRRGIRKLGLETELITLPRGIKCVLAEQLEWSGEPKKKFVVREAEKLKCPEFEEMEEKIKKKLDFVVEPPEAGDVDDEGSGGCVRRGSGVEAVGLGVA